MREFETRWVAVILAALLAASGCDGGPIQPDAGGQPDAGELDASVDPQDAGVDPDGGGEPDDAGGGPDGGDPDGGSEPETSAQIQAVLDAADGTVDLAIEGAIVTYVKPAFDDALDSAGFFLQAEMAGPALYVNVDPTSFTPALEVGQTVDLRVVEVGTIDGLRHASMVDEVTVRSSGADVSALAQDVSAIDLVAMLDDHTAELITLTAVIAGSFGVGGTGFTAAQITTEGVITPSVSMRLRVPQAVRDASTLGVGCTVELGPTPLWRFEANAQPSAWSLDDFTVTSCPAPEAAGDLVITEIGYQLSGADAQFVELHNPSEEASFDLTGCTLADASGAGSAFTLPSGVIVGPGQYVVIAGSGSEIAGAAVLPSTLTLDDMDSLELTCGTTSIDLVDWTTETFPGATDDASVQLDPAATDATQNDDLTHWCATPDGNTYGTMSRRGTPGAPNPPCFEPAVVLINEVKANVTNSCDLIELRVQRGGSMAGFELLGRLSSFTRILTFPAGFVVDANDIIVVHMNVAQQACHGGPVGMPPPNETTAVDEVPSSTYPRNYDGAWDFYANNGLAGTTQVLVLRDAAGTTIDGLLASNPSSGSSVPADAEAAATDLALAGGWTAPDGTVPSLIDADFHANAAQSLAAGDVTPSGQSIQRNSNVDMNHKDDWTQAPSTWGTLNAGQTPF